MSGSESKLIGGVDAGGTTFKCGLALSDGRLLANERFAVSSPEETLAACLGFFRRELQERGAQLAALGVASFGPVDIDPLSASYGTILKTPKPGWSGFDLLGAFAKGLGAPAAIDTDVNGALLAEMRWGAAQYARTAAYVTVGTGIGAGVAIDGRFVGKPSHPEFGHIRVKRHPLHEGFEGVCPFHGDCLEGLASATAMRQFFGDPASLPTTDAGWGVEAFYLAQACLALSLSFRPQRIVLGGGVMLAPHLLAMIRAGYGDLINGYLGQTAEEIGRLIVTPGLGDHAGLLGGVALGLDVLAGERG